MSMETPQFYKDDVVCRFDEKKQRVVYGVVDATYEEEVEEETQKPLKKGFLRVLWANSSREQIWRQSKVRLASRKIIPGDVVRRLVDGRDTQRGRCKRAAQVATVRVVGGPRGGDRGAVVERVAAARLAPLWPYETDAAVRLWNLYGRVRRCDQLLTARSRCGSTVAFPAGRQPDLEDAWLARRGGGGGREYLDPFYAGQEVACTPRLLERADWRFKSDWMKRNMDRRTHFTVVKVAPIDVAVTYVGESPPNALPIKDSIGGNSGRKKKWKTAVMSAIYKMFNMSTRTVSSDDLDELKVLGTADSKYVEFGERRFLTLSANDFPFKKQKEWIQKQSIKIRRLLPVGERDGQCRDTRNQSNSEPSDDGWETEENLSDSNEETEHHLQQKNQLINKTVPVEVIYSETFVTVVWQDGTQERDIPSTELYQSISLDDHEFFPGEFVLNNPETDTSPMDSNFGVIQSVNHLERVATVKWFTGTSGTESTIETVTSVYSIHKYPKRLFLPGDIVRTTFGESKMGYVVDSSVEGHTVVNWVSSDAAHPVDHIENCPLGSIEVIPEIEDVEFYKTEGITVGSVCFELIRELKASLNLVYTELKARIHNGLMSLFGSLGMVPPIAPDRDFELPPLFAPVEDSEVSRSIELPPVDVMKRSEQSEREASFAVLEEAPLSHKFYETKVEPIDRKRFFRCVQREHRLLEDSLPSGIHVRTFQDRLDLVSAMIVGPAGTPYEDALFFFDLQLGSDYPSSAPGCSYLSYSSERLNPNLYTKGLVCLSLLGTWSGKESEVWNPRSTLLQLLVSIQGLILVGEPYFNEPGFERQAQSQQGSENSRLYNETVLLRVTEAMARTAARPPPVFAADVAAHFRARARPLAARLRGYCDGGSGEPGFPLLPVSRGFAISLGIALDRFLKNVTS